MSRAGPRILIVAGDVEGTESLRRSIALVGGEAVGASDPMRAYELMGENAFDVVTFDVSMAERSGALADGGLLETFAARWPEVALVALVSELDSPSAVNALRAGAMDCLPTAPTPEQVELVLEKARAVAEHRSHSAPSRLHHAEALLGESRPMRDAIAVLERAARSNATVLIRGESGTGKELVARALHERSARSAGPFVKIDCAALPEALLESELFGYERGAFTGAVARKPGRIELAQGGTLFLDEIGELGAPLQAKLLRLIQDKKFERLGGTATHSADVRIATATHRDLETMTQRGEFRQDLFYRVNVVPIWLPPLRARRGDIEMLARHFCTALAQEHGRTVSLDEGALALLRAQRWPGNVRQLQNFIERLVVLGDGPVITAQQARSELDGQAAFVTEAATRQSTDAATDEGGERGSGRLSEELRLAERRALLRALKSAAGNRTMAARILGISRSNLYNKLAEHELV